MQTELITVTEYCMYHHTDIRFIDALEQNGLISMILVNEERFIAYDQLPQIERYTRLHDELDINIEGIDTIIYLLEKMGELQREVSSLKNRLSRYE